MRPRRAAQLASAAPELPSTRFEVCDRERRVMCAVSDEALEAASNLAHPSTVILRRRSFDRFRTLIDAAAKLKLATMPDGFAGPLTISSADLRRLPAREGAPQFGSTSWAMMRQTL